jgi:hypothetical protein
MPAQADRPGDRMRLGYRAPGFALPAGIGQFIAG